MRLCDDQIDRDGERFDTAALPPLAKLFIGKTGIVDHKWSSDSQVARIFATEIVQEDGVSYIKAWAYIRRGGHADEVIADIEAGIKKEISVGCAMGRSVCSICGSDYGTCGHMKGEAYDGAICCAILKEPMDAYEFSFVAVPAQREAGVLKALGSRRTLKELAEEFGAQAEYRALFKEAQLGRQYQAVLGDEVIRLCLALELGIEEPVLRSIVSKVSAEDLMKMKAALTDRMEQMYPVKCQLPGSAPTSTTIESGFMI
ncbi:MAG: hypothetical protein E7466_00695 [Ruminococcaceae bacterium]|nr:hypothetical protein [Oscillospiraceae bacterium]MBQ3214934.1 hypothetical protein [Oscillospiraceae bacterium]